jgi:hypothetical protein
MELRELALNVLKEDFEGVEYLLTDGKYMTFKDENDTPILGEVFFSEAMGKFGITLSQYNKGWREITTIHE